MPTTKTAAKSMRQDKKRQTANAAVKSELRTYLKKFERLLASEKKDEAKQFLKQVVSKLDTAAGKKIISKNRAARKTSKLTKKTATG